MPQLPELLTTAEVAEKLRTSDETVRRWAASGQLASIELPSGQRRFRRSDIEAILGVAGPTEAGAA